MKKTYCDICKKELKGTGKPISFKVDIWKGENEKNRDCKNSWLFPYRREGNRCMPGMRC